MKKILILIPVTSLLVQTASADIWDDLAKYKMGDEGDKPVPVQIEELIANTPHAQRGPIEDALIKIIESNAATPHAKWFSCRMLQRVGTDKCVPALAKLLGDERLSHFARLALERMIESEPAGAALRGALDNASDKLRPGILGSIAERRDERAIRQVSALVSSSNPLVGAAALQALGKIGGPEGKRALENVKVPGNLKSAWLDACLVYAEHAKDADVFLKIYEDSGDDTFRAAALVGLLATDARRGSAMAVESLKGDDSYLRRTALRCVAIEPSPELTQAVSGMLGGLSTVKQAELVRLLGERGDRAAVASVSKFLASEERKLRAAAIVAVGLLGDADSVAPLLTQASDPGYRQTAIDSIAAMPGEGVDEALLAALTDQRVKASAIEAIARRNVTQASPALMRLTADDSPEVRKTAWAGLGLIASAADLDVMMTRMLAASNDDEKAGARKAIEEVCSRASNKDACLEAVGAHYRNPDLSVKLLVLDIAGTAGGPKALDIARDALQSGNQTLYDKAVRTLAAWPSEEAAPDLLELAQNAPDNVTRILSLQGYIKLADKIRDHRKKAEALKACRDLVVRVDEKRILIMALRNTRHPDALAMLDGYLDDAQVRKEAQVAVVDLSGNLVKKRPAEVAAAMEKVMSAPGVNPDVLKKARDLHKQASTQR